MEKVAVLCRFLDIHSVTKNHLLKYSLAHAFCCFLTAVEDVNPAVATRAGLLLDTIKRPALQVVSLYGKRHSNKIWIFTQCLECFRCTASQSLLELLQTSLVGFWIKCVVGQNICSCFCIPQNLGNFSFPKNNLSPYLPNFSIDSWSISPHLKEWGKEDLNLYPIQIVRN